MACERAHVVEKLLRELPENSPEDLRGFLIRAQAAHVVVQGAYTRLLQLGSQREPSSTDALALITGQQGLVNKLAITAPVAFGALTAQQNARR